jgi:hypothetical protein
VRETAGARVSGVVSRPASVTGPVAVAVADRTSCPVSSSACARTCVVVQTAEPPTARSDGRAGRQLRVAPAAARTTPVRAESPSLITVQVTETTSPADGFARGVLEVPTTATEGPGVAPTFTLTVTSTCRPETGSVMR